MVKVLKAAVVVGAAALLGYLLMPKPVSRLSHNGKVLALDLPQLRGGRWSLAQQRGNVVLVNFWATWCPPCRMETPGLVSLSKRYAGKGVEIVGVSMDDDPARDVPPFVARYQIPYPILVPPGDSPFLSSIASLPTSLLIDRKGRVARTYLGAVDEQTFARDIDRLLSEQS